LPQRFDTPRPGRLPLLRPALALASLALIVLLFLVRTVAPSAGRLTHGFLAYYVAGQAIHDGVPATRLYDDRWFVARVKELSQGTVADIYLANPPTLAVAWSPLAYLSPTAAREVWTWGVNLPCLALSLWLLAAEIGMLRRPWAIVAMSALVTLAAPTREQFSLGQMYVCLLLLHVIGWRAYIQRRNAIAGIALGLAIALKISGWPIAVLMLVQRRWAAAGWAAATAAVSALITLPWVGVSAWNTWLFRQIPHTMRSPDATVTAYQDTTGFWQHLFRFDAIYNPSPLFDAPALASLLTLVTTVGAILALMARKRSASIGFAAAVALTELLSPAAEQYHYVILLLPLAVLWHEAWRSQHAGLGACALLATLLIACPIDYKSAHPMWALLHNYPRLFGGWIAFTALLYADRYRAEHTDSADLTHGLNQTEALTTR
jgi:glycosyl transferase family 87